MLAALAVATMSAAAMPPAGPLTLEQAVRKAIVASGPVRAAKARLGLARERTNEVWAGVYPQIALSSSLMRFDLLGGSGGMGTSGLGGGGLGGFGGLGGLGGLGGTSIDGAMGGLGGFDGGIAAAGAAGGGQPFHQVQAQAQITQVLFDGMRTQSGLRLADLAELAGRSEVAAAVRRTAIETATAYLQVLRAEALADLAARAVDQARRQLERAEIREKTGAGMRLDVLQARTGLSAFRVQQAAAANGARRARVMLGALLGEEAAAPLEPVVLPKVDADLERDLERAVARRPEAEQLDLKIAMDREQITIQERSAWPTAGAFGMLSWQGGGGSRYDALGVQANWPLFDAGKVRAKVAQARAELAADEATREGLARSVEADTRRALLDRTDARERVKLAGEGLESAREALRLAEIRHQTGVGTMFDVSDAQQAVVRAESDLIDARYEVELAEVRLAAALGVPLSDLGLTLGDQP
ncbi:MAG: TolC family protein [Candidatus Sericytochromatia bacterium]|nr:TolC family protein [Candidatus Tanganyikabacteria bacterium]